MATQKGTASTRLLSMKFMQRAAAVDDKSSAPSTPDGRPAKRQRISNGASTLSTPALSDQARLKAAQAEEELQRSAVMARIAAEAGETHWVLNVKDPNVKTTPLRIVQTGFADLDANDDDAGSESGEEMDEAVGRMRFVKGRMVFGQMKKPEAEPKEENSSSGSESDSDSSQDSEDEEDSYRDVRAERAEKKLKANAEERRRLAALRQKKEIRLNSSPRTPKDLDATDLKHISGSAPRSQFYRPGEKRRK